MSESSDYEPAPEWKGHDFKAARKAFDVHAGRSYEAAKETRRDFRELIVPQLVVPSPKPLFIVYDHTGSMGAWVGIMVGKAPILDFEVKTEYLGEDYQIVLAATGDANCDSYPLEVRPPAKGIGIKKAAEELIIEHMGGGQICETYELAALYFARNVSMPNVLVKPPIIFIGDEKPYPYVDRHQAKKYAFVELERQMPTEQVFQELQRKFSVYMIRKPYGEIPEGFNFDLMRPVDQEIYLAWQKLLEPGHVLNLSDPERVVDVIFGILSKETDKIAYFRKEIESRQSKDKGGGEKISIAYRSLEPLIGPPEAGNPYYQPAVNQAGAKSKNRGAKPLV